MILGKTGYSAALRYIYKDGLPPLWQEISTFMQMVKRDTSFEGDLYKVRVLYAGIGGSVKFAVAQNNMGMPGIADFGIDVAKDYALGSIDELTMKRTKSNRGAQAKALDTMVKSANYEIQQSVGQLLWGNGGGARAQLAASAAGAGTATITLKYSTDTFKFEKGMWVQGASTDGLTGAVAAGRARITAIDRSAGTITTSANWNSLITGITDDWYLFREGDFAGAAPGTSTDVMTGIFGWTPIAAPAATLFWGVDRTVDSVRLAGSRISGVGMPLSEAAFEARGEAKNIGGHPDVAFLNPKRFVELEKDASAKQTFPVDLKAPNTKMGVKGLGFHRSTGDVVFVEDYMCPYTRMLVTEMDSWELISADAVPHFKTQAGDKLVWETSADAKGFRLACYPNLVNHNPRGTTVVNLV